MPRKSANTLGAMPLPFTDTFTAPTGQTFVGIDGDRATVETPTLLDLLDADADPEQHARVVPSDASRAVGRFNPDGPDGYRSSHSPDAPLRGTRAQAAADWLDAQDDADHEPPADPMTEFFGDVIHAYTRADGFADGWLVDVSETAAEAGFKWPVAVTRTVWEDCCEWSEAAERRKGFTGQSVRGRLWDVLNLARWTAQQGSGTRTRFQVYRVPVEGRGTKPRPVTLVLLTGPGDNAEPVVTICQPGEE